MKKCKEPSTKITTMATEAILTASKESQENRIIHTTDTTALAEEATFPREQASAARLRCSSTRRRETQIQYSQSKKRNTTKKHQLNKLKNKSQLSIKKVKFLTTTRDVNAVSKRTALIAPSNAEKMMTRNSK